MAAILSPEKFTNLRMQHEKILAHLEMEGTAVKSKDIVSVTDNNKTNPKCREMFERFSDELKCLNLPRM